MNADQEYQPQQAPLNWRLHTPTPGYSVVSTEIMTNPVMHRSYCSELSRGWILFISLLISNILVLSLCLFSLFTFTVNLVCNLNYKSKYSIIILLLLTTVCLPALKKFSLWHCLMDGKSPHTAPTSCTFSLPFFHSYFEQSLPGSPHNTGSTSDLELSALTLFPGLSAEYS